MPEVIDVSLFSHAREIPPKQMIGAGPINVSGAQHITVNVEVSPNTGSVLCRISFGRRRDTGETADFVEQKLDPVVGTARDKVGILSTFMPVQGPLLTVDLHNRGAEPVIVHYAAVYGIRETTLPSTGDTPGSAVGQEQ